MKKKPKHTDDFESYYSINETEPPCKSHRKKITKSVSQLKKEADAVFSKYIRQRDGGDMCRCFTCGVVKNAKQMQNGHYYSRSVNILRYDERNCHAQCVGCNMFKEGAKPAYTLALLRKYGPEILEELEADSKKYKQWTPEELINLIKKHK